MRRIPALPVLLAVFSCTSSERAPQDSSPEERAVAYLSREVRQWPRKNKCFSCHNNGDAARALYTARRRSIPFDPAALDETTRWLERPEGWKDNGPEGEFSDKKLAALQFASALATGVEADAIGRGSALQRAAELVRAIQGEDGSLQIGFGGLAGSPVTYGRTLATVMALKLFRSARADEAAVRADRWLRRQRPVRVLDAGAVLITQGDEPETRSHCLQIVRKGQTRDGGWGPYANSPPEPFDTAIVLLGLSTIGDAPGVREMIRRGRAYLVATQLPDGSWPETTRPPGEESYSHRISTSGWATLALLETRNPP